MRRTPYFILEFIEKSFQFGNAEDQFDSKADPERMTSYSKEKYVCKSCKEISTNCGRTFLAVFYAYLTSSLSLFLILIENKERDFPYS